MSQDPGNKIPTAVLDLCVGTRAEATEMDDSGMVKIHKEIKAKVVETVANTIENAIQTIYSDSY